MESKLNLEELIEVLTRVLEEVNAMELMIWGLTYVNDPYAAGLSAAYRHLRTSVIEIKRLLEISGLMSP